MSRELPIIFDTESVDAILTGHKTQTRRVMKPFPNVQCIKLHQHGDEWLECWSEHGMACCRGNVRTRHNSPRRRGDLLWVKETWLELDSRDVLFMGERYYYKADCTADSERLREEYGYRWRSPLFMPKVAARLWLRVTDVRAERLQDITSHAALAESVATTRFWNPAELKGRPFEEKWWDDYHFWTHYPQKVYANVWDRLNAKRGYGWDSNPWVWVYEFKVMTEVEK